MNATRADPAGVANRDVWLSHPWALREPPADLPAGALRLSICPAEFHDTWAWSESRWAFVGERMAALSTVCWYDSAAAIDTALRSARSVLGLDDAHLDTRLRSLAGLAAPRKLFSDVERPCTSFSQWWKQAATTNRDSRPSTTKADP